MKLYIHIYVYICTTFRPPFAPSKCTFLCPGQCAYCSESFTVSLRSASVADVSFKNQAASTLFRRSPGKVEGKPKLRSATILACSPGPENTCTTFRPPFAPSKCTFLCPGQCAYCSESFTVSLRSASVADVSFKNQAASTLFNLLLHAYQPGSSKTKFGCADFYGGFMWKLQRA